MQLKDQVVIVTGAGRGIGRAIAERLAGEGARVVLAARSQNELEGAAEAITAAGGQCLPIPTDVTDVEAVESMVAVTEDHFGFVDLLVNDAGRFWASGPIWEMDVDLWWGDVTVNLLGVFLCSRTVTRRMVERRHGRIINLVGRGYDIPFPNGSGYAASKAGVMRFTETLAAEAWDYGVRIFAMAPGLVKTALTDFHMERNDATQLWPQVVEAFATGKNVPPTLAATLALQLASGRFDALSGHVFEVTDDMEGIAASAADIQASDLYTLRVRRVA